MLAVATALLLVVCALALLLIAVVFLAQAQRTIQRRRDASVEARWRRPLAMAAAGVPVERLPRARRRDSVVALELWIRNRDSVSSAGDLVTFAEATGLRAQAHRLAQRRRGRAHMAGVVALGWLGRDEDVRLLEVIARRGREPMSTAALASLVRLDAPAAFPVIRRRLRPGPQPLPPVVSQALAQAPRGALAALVRNEATRRYTELPGLLRVIGLRRDTLGLDAVRTALVDPDAPVDAYAAGLSALAEIGEPSDVVLASRLLAHEHWAVRVRAVHAVARLGGRVHTRVLADLLDDVDPWVRRRVAEAVAADPTYAVDTMRLSEHARLALEEAITAREAAA